MQRIIALAATPLLVIALSFFCGMGQAQAQEDHTHESPHGGDVKPTGDHHVEFLVVEGDDNRAYVVVFLLNEDLSSASVENVEGVVYVTLPDKTKQTLNLVATVEMPKVEHHEEGEGEHEEGGEHEAVPHLQAEVSLGGADTFEAVVSLSVGGKRTNLRYKYTKEDHEHEEGDPEH